MPELEFQKKNNLHEFLESVLKLFNLLFHRKDVILPKETEIDNIPFRSRLAGYINLHSSTLLNEFEDYFNNYNEYTFCYDNNTFGEINSSLRMNSQLELLYNIVGKNEFKKRLSTVVKSVILGYGRETSPNQFFLQNDTLKLRENYYDDFWFKVVDVKSKMPGKLTIQLLNNPTIFMKTNLSSDFLFKSNPEFIIRHFISENIDPHEFFGFDKPLWDDEKWNDFWDIPLKQDLPKDYSFLRTLDQMTHPDSGFHALWKFDNKSIDIKSRFKIFIDIIGHDFIKEKIHLLEKSMQFLSETELCKSKIFRQNDIVILEENTENIYIVKSQDAETFDVTIYNIMNKEDEIVSSQIQLLKENPQYYSRLQNEVKEKNINYNRNKTRS